MLCAPAPQLAFGKIRPLLQLQAKTNARGRDNSMFSSSAIKPMNRLTQVLKHLTLKAQTQAEWPAGVLPRHHCLLTMAQAPQKPLQTKATTVNNQTPVLVGTHSESGSGTLTKCSKARNRITHFLNIARFLFSPGQEGGLFLSHYWSFSSGVKMEIRYLYLLCVCQNNIKDS